ncbi:hypothetical protein [Desulfogranum marinum]|uniref:hypothetical protein n=1 Tax=Desulfogranum marinum TaxID=453220 RepID=UPI001963A58C|nr:hypothetical protein [Desulfogranum marinum]MBM9513310.1 hypothetical protein [Desulfogranum marinum]
MKPLFDVPFLPDSAYVDLLVEHADELDCIHFSLLPDFRLDSRILLDDLQDSDKYLEQLGRLQGVKKYALMNSRFYSPELLSNKENMQCIVNTLQDYLEHDLITGVIYCDHYLLQYLSDAAPEVASSLEAVPGVNTMLDSFSKIDAQLSYIELTKFKRPQKIILDRSLNRDLDALAKVALKTHTQFPHIRLEVLANEGCLPYCPFKLSHDSYIALANINGQKNNFGFNDNLGCVNVFYKEPHRILFSPFIRPEDIELYYYHIDTIKLCGRSLGPAFLGRLFKAYSNRHYDGNLLDLLDATNWLADKLYIDNGSLSFDFANMLSQCDGRCEKCGFCQELFEMIAQWQPLSIPDRRKALN